MGIFENIDNIRIGSTPPDSILYSNYYAHKANQGLYFKNIIPKDNTKIWNSVFGEWQVNDDWEIEILNDKRIAIKKFRIDTWGIRKILYNNKPEDTDTFVGNIDWKTSFRVKVTGLDYVHNHVVYQEDSQGNKIYGFAKAYAGTEGYNVYWYPGQFTSGNSIQGLGIQQCIGYTANQNEVDDSFCMGKHPWDIGTVVNVTDKDIIGKGSDNSYRATCIGLWGGYQTASSWHEYNIEGYEGKAYKVWDISDTPIIIDLDVIDTNAPIDPTSVECWEAYCGDTVIWKKEKTVENCLIKYALLYPNDYNLYTSNFNSVNSIKWINPIKFKVNSIPTEGINLYTSTLQNNSNYWALSFINFGIKIINKPDNVTVKFKRVIANTNANDSIEVTLNNGINNIPAYSKTVYRKDNNKPITAQQFNLSIEGETTDKFIIEFIPDYESASVFKIDTSAWSSILPKISVPTVFDIRFYIENTKFRMANYNEELWDIIKEWYEFHTGVNDNFRGGNIFNGSKNLKEITIKIADSFQFGEDNFAGSDIETINFIQENESAHFSAPQRLLRSANKLKNINITWANPNSNNNWLCGVNTIADGMSGLIMETYPERFINWDQNRSNILSETYPCTLFQYAFNYSTGLVTIPAYPGNENENTIVTHRSPERAFYGCSSLVTVGPILDLRLAIPSNSSGIFHDCNKLEQLRVNNLNHGNWNFDGVNRNGIYHGTLKSLNSESVAYLFNNLADLTTSDSGKHEDTIDKSFKSWSSSYKNSADSSPDWDYTLTTITRFSCRKRYASIEDSSFIAYTNQALTNMNVKVEGLEDGDVVVFLDENGNNSTEWTANGSKSITKDSGVVKGFKLISSDINNRNTVTITIENGLDYTNPRVSSASIYCPVEWEDKVTSAMISAANVKGWNIYIDGVEVQSN